MFAFQNLEVYQKAKSFNSIIFKYVTKNDARIDFVIKKQLKRAALSIQLNIAEGSGRFSKADRKNFFVIARGSVFECYAILDFLKDESLIESDLVSGLNSQCESLSKMLFAMIKNLQ
jgi:four helix bundle protein